jgi:hypothetical protein
VSGSDAGHSLTGASTSAPSQAGEPGHGAQARGEPTLRSAVQQAAKSAAALVSCGGAQYAPPHPSRARTKAGSDRYTAQAGLGAQNTPDPSTGQPASALTGASTPPNDGLVAASSNAASPLRVQSKSGQEFDTTRPTSSQEPAGPSMSMPRHFQAQAKYQQQQPELCQRSYHFAVEIWPGPVDTVFRHTKVCSLSLSSSFLTHCP